MFASHNYRLFGSNEVRRQTQVAGAYLCIIIGSGNDHSSTPRIILYILGADPNLDLEPLSFVSLGEGANITIWARYTLDCMNAVVMSYHTLTLSGLENQRSVLVQGLQAIVVNEIRRCCLYT